MSDEAIRLFSVDTTHINGQYVETTEMLHHVYVLLVSKHCSCTPGCDSSDVLLCLTYESMRDAGVPGVPAHSQHEVQDAALMVITLPGGVQRVWICLDHLIIIVQVLISTIEPDKYLQAEKCVPK